MPPAARLIAFAMAAGVLLLGCGNQAQAPAGQTSLGPASAGQSPAAGAPLPAAVISNRDGPSWKGRLGETVQVDWYDQSRDETHSEQITVLAVKRLPNPDDEGGPNEFGDDYGPYEWKYGIRVRLTSLDEGTARRPGPFAAGQELRRLAPPAGGAGLQADAGDAFGRRLERHLVAGLISPRAAPGSTAPSCPRHARGPRCLRRRGHRLSLKVRCKH